MKLVELRLAEQLQKEIRAFQVLVADQLIESDLASAEDRAEYHLLFDETLGPYINDEYKLLALFEEEIVNDSVQIERARERLRSRADRRRELLAKVNAFGGPAADT